MSIIGAIKNADKSIGMICDTRIFSNSYNVSDGYDKILEGNGFLVGACGAMIFLEAIKDIKESTDLFKKELRSHHDVRNFLYAIRELLSSRYHSTGEDSAGDVSYSYELMIVTHIDGEPKIFFSNGWAYMLDIDKPFHFGGFSSDTLKGIAMQKYKSEAPNNIVDSHTFLREVMDDGMAVTISYGPGKIFKALHLTV